MISQHEHVRNDEYCWLKDDNWKDIVSGNLNFANPQILEHIKSENEYRDFMMDDYEEVKKNIYEDILSRVKEDRISLPEKKVIITTTLQRRKG